MHLPLLVLQAVLFNIATAGLIRTNRHPVRYVSQLPPTADLTTGRLGIHARFQNSSSISEASLHSSSLSPTLTPSPVPFKAAQTPSEHGQSKSAIPTSGQVGSVPAFGSGPGAATTEESHTSTGRPPPSTSSHRSVMRDTAAHLETTASIQSSKPALQTIPASIVQQTAENSEAGGASTQTPAVQKSATTPTSLSSPKTPLSNATAATHTQQPAQSVSTKPSAVNAGSQQPTATPTNTPAGDNGNIAMALGFNSVWATMDAESPCDANDKNQAVACVSGQYAQCSGGKYIMTACPQGQQCFALPLSKDFRGVTVQCASLQDASKQLGQTPSASPSTPTSTLSTSSKSQQPSVPKPTVTSTSSATVQSPAVGSAQATPSAERTSVAQPSKTETVQTTESHQTTFVGQQPTETPKESTTQPKPTETASATKGSDSTTATPQTTSSHRESQTPSPSPQVTKSAQHSDSPSPSPSPTTAAAQTTSDDPIIITPIPDSSNNDVQPAVSAAKVAIAASSITPAPIVPGGPVTVTETVTTTATTTVLGDR